jgi:hypothetical protein
MTERAGCVASGRGYGSRKFKGIKYHVHKVYVAEQTNAISSEKQDKLNAENTALMERDRAQLISEGYKTKVRHENCGQTHILYRMALIQ